MSDAVLQSVMLIVAIATIVTLVSVIFVPGVRDAIMDPSISAETSNIELGLRALAIGAFAGGIVFVGGVILAQRIEAVSGSAVTAIVVAVGSFLRLRQLRAR